MADALPTTAQNAAGAGNELAVLRVEIAKWQQRVPKIMEILRTRSEALAVVEQENRELRQALAAAPAAGQTATSAEQHALRQAMETELADLRIASAWLQRDVTSLETRNRMLAETVEVLTTQFAHAQAELLRLRGAVATGPDQAPVQPVATDVETAPAPVGADGLSLIRGVGVKSVQMLVEAGVDSLQALADLDDAVLDNPEGTLFAHRARIRREGWVEQAKMLLASAPKDATPLPS